MSGAIQYATWYVGQPLPSLDVGSEQFVSCAANGAELTYITTKFTGLPMRGNGIGRTILWRGESASFILDNLKKGVRQQPFARSRCGFGIAESNGSSAA